jgi:hypothetical protein
MLDTDSWRTAILAGVLSLLLAVVQLFMVVTVLLVVGIIALIQMLRFKRFHLKTLALSIIFSIPYLLYQYWILNTDPILKQWTSQNLTPTPAVWDLLLSLSPAVFFALVSLIRYWKLKPDYRLIITAWLFVTVLLTYLPMALQRRFLSGVYIAVVLLAVLGILTFFERPLVMSRLYRILLFLSLPGTIIIILLSVFGIRSKSPALYLTYHETQGLNWLKSNSSNGSLVLASPGMGGFIPAYSGNCVIYGHPFESLDYERNKKMVMSLLDGSMTPTQIEEFLRREGVDYVFYGPREKNLGNVDYYDRLPVAFSNGDVIIYQVLPD